MNRTYRHMPYVNALSALGLLCACSASAVASEPRAFILDTGNQTVTALDMEKVAIQGSVAPGGNLTTMLQLPHSQKLAVFDRPGIEDRKTGFHPTGKAAVNFVDMTSMKRTSRLEVCSNRGRFVVSYDGKRMAVQCLAVTSTDPSEMSPIELLIVNTETEQIIGRSPLKRLVNLLITPDSRTLITFAPPSSPQPAELQFLDFETGKSLGLLTPKDPVTSATLSGDGQYLYLLDARKPSDNPEKNVKGSLSVISVSARSELAAIDVGFNPRGLIRDEKSDRILVLGDALPGKEQPDGVLRVIKGTETLGISRVAPDPQFVRVSPDGSLLYVVSQGYISIVDYASFQSLQRMPVEGKHGRSKEPLGEFAITADGRRALALSSGREVRVFDLEGRKLLAPVTVGRGSVLFVEALTAGLQTYVSAANATYVGSGMYTYHIYSIAPPPGGYYQSVVLSPDSKFAYVLNSATYDVTVVDAQNATVLSKIGIVGLSPQLEMLPGGKALCVKEDVYLTFIDTNTNQKIDFGHDAGCRWHDRVKVGGLRAMKLTFQVSPSGTRALAFAKKNLVGFDLTTVRVLARLTDFQDVSEILFEQ